MDCSSEDSDSDDTISGAASEPSPVVSTRNQTPSLDVLPSAKHRSSSSTSSTLSTTPTSGSKPPSLEEYAYAAQLEKHMSTSPLQALAIGFQTVRDLVLGPRAGSPQLTVPSTKMHTPSLGESFIMVADSTSDASERERRLQEELARVQSEFQKVQHMLDTMMQDQQQSNSRMHASQTTHHGRSGRKSIQNSSEKAGVPTVSIAREAFLKQNLRENYLAGSEAHLSKSELETEIKNLREQLTAAEQRNSEWASKWDKVKQKALGRSAGRTSSSMAAPPRSTPSQDADDVAYRLQVSTPSSGRP